MTKFTAQALQKVRKGTAKSISLRLTAESLLG